MTAGSATAPKEYDVVVIGAGPVGLFTAVLLGQYGVRTLVVERRPQMYTYPRAIGIDDETMRAMQAIGIADSQLPQLKYAPTIEYLSPVGYSRFQPPATPGPYGHPFLATFLQPRLEEGLRARLAELPSVELRTGIEFVDFDEAGGIITLMRDADGRELRACSRFLLGCDGGRSRVRQQVGVELLGATQEEKWLVVDVRDDEVLAEAMRSRHQDACAQPMVSITLPEGLRRIECRLAADSARTEAVGPELIRDALRPLVADHPVDVVRAAVYERYFRHAEQLRAGNVFLLGDAAHLVPPYGGQGLCSGIRDAINLAWKLAFVLGGRLPVEVLDSYDRERGDHMKRTVAFVRHLARRIEGDTGEGQVEEGLSVADQRRAKPAPEYATGFFDEKAGGGAMFPQPTVVSDGVARPLDDVLGPGFAVLVRTNSRIAGIGWRALFGPDTFVAQVRTLDGPRHAEPGVPVLGDPTGELVSAIGAADFVVLRPDRFVFAAYRDEQAPRVAERLSAWRRSEGGVR
ncbi:FAD-dependent monooxygenase [Nocardia altamirensis]|uniref:FAD-dependent monooxygenase n=1 Tax=Nocardia altamirensis TaxID=472158 RepID=UPI000A06FB75|nr:FAD-dependent monooxygenase [Nocardia altamirensis]